MKFKVTANQSLNNFNEVALKDIYTRFDISIVELLEDEEEAAVYFNNDMLNNNLIIREETLWSGDLRVETVISVRHFNEWDAGIWYLYWGDLLEPIQVYRIIRDLFEMYNELSLSLFLKTISHLCSTSQFASQQIQRENRDRIVEGIKDEIEQVRLC